MTTVKRATFCFPEKDSESQRSTLNVQISTMTALASLDRKLYRLPSPFRFMVRQVPHEYDPRVHVVKAEGRE